MKAGHFYVQRKRKITPPFFPEIRSPKAVATSSAVVENEKVGRAIGASLRYVDSR
jgi:hypothetical protein